MTLTMWLVLIIAILLCIVLYQYMRLRMVWRWVFQQRAELNIATNSIERQRLKILELKQHTLAHVVYDEAGDPTKVEGHEHELAEALVNLNTVEPDEAAPILEEQRPDTSPTRVPTTGELQLAARGRLSDKRPDTGSIPTQDT